MKKTVVWGVMAGLLFAACEPGAGSEDSTSVDAVEAVETVGDAPSREHAKPNVLDYLGCHANKDCGESESCLFTCESRDQCTSETQFAPIGMCIVSAPGSWSDPESGLTWQIQPAFGVVPAELTGGEVVELQVALHVVEARAYCEGLQLDGHDDWRYPTIMELRTLVRGCAATQPDGECVLSEYCDWGPWCEPDPPCEGCPYDEGPSEGCYWPGELQGKCGGYGSGSTGVEPDEYWYVHFDSAEVTSVTIDLDSYVRCVR